MTWTPSGEGRRSEKVLPFSPSLFSNSGDEQPFGREVPIRVCDYGFIDDYGVRAYGMD